MTRIYLIASLMIVLFGSVLVLDPYRATRTVQAQAEPNAQAGPNAVYLPLIARGPDTSHIKLKSGIHMGNRNTDWQDTFLQRIQPPPVGAADGKWPAAVVIQSDQIYDLSRATSEQCWVNGATVKQTNSKDYAVYDYLTRAISRTNGTIVVIRITPSPGNFSDYDHPGGAHNLLATEIPSGGNYCGDTEIQKKKVEKYRDIHDIAAEMHAIYQVNKAHGWPLDRFYFEPTNEPNYEWYMKLVVEDGVPDLKPNVNNKQAWIDMDNYFAALYDLVKRFDPAPDYDLRVLAPPMSQGLDGEHFGLGTCKKFKMDDDPNHSGFDFMKQVYGYDFDGDPFHPPALKADGFSLHNYWKYGQEAWDGKTDVSFDAVCNSYGGSSYLSKSDHISQYFPAGIAIAMRSSGKPIFITEADLKSPCQDTTSPIISKDRIIDPNHPESALIDFPEQVKSSLNNFVQTEHGARNVITWLLVNQFEDAGPCGNTEMNWHEAYWESGTKLERDWFEKWWPTAP